MPVSEQRLSQIVQQVITRLAEDGKWQPVQHDTLAEPGSRMPGGSLANAAATGNANEGIFATLTEAITAATKAQYILEWERTLGDRQAMIAAMRQAVLQNLEALAQLAVEETGLGRVADKINKNRLVATKTPGMEDLATTAWSGDHGLTLYELAPWGVIAAICPMTNPSETVICNAIGMIAAGNAVCFNPHPNARRITHFTIDMLNRALQSAGAPPNLITSVAEPTIQTAQALMNHPGIRLLVVTGGPAVVKVAMGSGKKVIAAGPGNPPAVCDESADLEKAGRDMVLGASFDNNIVCCAEKEFIAVGAIADPLKQVMKKNGALELDADQTERLMKIILAINKGPGQSSEVNKKFIGKDAKVILREIGLSVGDEVRIALCEVNRNHTLLYTEQLLPVIPLARVRNFEEALELAKETEQGMGHTASLHSRYVDRMSRMAKYLDTAIFVKNGPHYAGLGEGGEGPTSFTIAHPTGEGLTHARHFARLRRCTLVDAFRIV
ncbi:MAG: aldehyde dehydrogenase EutE [Cyanobacteria bacterium NC_groundwater_1444_Ag_S-0.65um_54_12]|nr:aldehyde dehydrogenase EutE [Cyanobacteria bacterium NC_groundwater_1444_Ag_S-0.65um_54_12]